MRASCALQCLCYLPLNLEISVRDSVEVTQDSVDTTAPAVRLDPDLTKRKAFQPGCCDGISPR